MGKRKTKGKSSLLSGHRKQGGMLKAPMNLVPNLQPLSYVEVMLPELVWISVAMEVHEGPEIQVFREMEKLYQAVGGTGDVKGNLAWTSSWKNLEERERNRARIEATRLRSIPTAVEIMCRVYPSCPLEVLRNGRGRYEEPKKREALDWEIISEATIKGMNKRAWRGIALHGALFHYRIMTKTVVLHPSVTGWEDVNAALEDPDSENGKKGAAWLRAFAMGEASMHQDKGWARTFWDENARRTPCWL